MRAVQHQLLHPWLSIRQGQIGHNRGIFLERQSLRQQILTATKRLAERRSLIYNYVSGVHHELKYSQIAQDIFSDYRRFVDSTIGLVVPDAVKKFTAIHENLRSANPEDWSNSAHGCRRILQDLADAIFPPQKECRIVDQEGKKREVKLSPDNYINRLICYAQDNVKSKKYLEIVGSHLRYLGDRLDSIFDASQKGSHKQVTKEEANRVVIFTYILVGDILALIDKKGINVLAEYIPRIVNRPASPMASFQRIAQIDNWRRLTLGF